MPPRPPFMRNGPKKKKYTYIPPPSSGAYVILVAMLKAEQNELIKNLTKQQVLDYCTRYSQSGLRESSKIWASMKGLIDKSLVGRQIARDSLYFLADEGRDLAQKLVAIAEGTEVADSLDEASRDTAAGEAVSSSQQSASNSAFAWSDQVADSGLGCFTGFELKAGTYDIIMIVDQREKIDIVSLDEQVRIEMRTLACGDYIWIARPKNISPQDRTRDLVLDYVVERKRLDDLASSIFDGRFEQQKHRLLNSGIRRPVYLIEDIGALRASNLTSSGLAQAVVNILTHDKIGVERVKNAAHANDYLISMTKCLKKFYSNMDLSPCSQERMKDGEAAPNELMTFSEFQTKGAKITNWTVREMFAKHLIQIRGTSDKSVSVIIKQYPTISAINEAYRKCKDTKEKENLLAKLKIPDANRTIGPAISKRVYTCYAKPAHIGLEDENNDDNF